MLPSTDSRRALGTNTAMRPRLNASRSFALRPSRASPVLFVLRASLLLAFSSDSRGRFLPANEVVRDEKVLKGSLATTGEDVGVMTGGAFSRGEGCRGVFEVCRVDHEESAAGMEGEMVSPYWS